MIEGVQVYYSEAVPREALYLIPTWPDAFSLGPWAFRRDPWPEPTYPLAPEYTDERRRALNFLAGLLDEWCEREGWDPEKVWREPKWREQTVGGQMRFMAHERVALSVIRSDAAAIVKGVV